MANEQRLPIAVCMIAGNEAARIRRALESVAGWTSEIIVVLNADVNDGTDQIAAEFGAKVFREPWKGHIAQKNSAAQKAGSEWLLGLDADEVVSAGLRTELEQLFAVPEKLKPFAAFCFPRCSWYCGRWIRHGDWYPDRQTRLWRHGAAKWGGIDPHDKLLVQGSVARLKGELRHYTMESLEQQMKKTVAYANDFARHCAEQKKTVSFLDLWLRPAWRFGRAYLLRLGLLDGWQGFAIARMAAVYTFLRYLKAYQRQQETKPD
jgi:glycosyltransferase involved in cell wall biosynthesis